jgi:hypothetical protein
MLCHVELLGLCRSLRLQISTDSYDLLQCLIMYGRFPVVPGIGSRSLALHRGAKIECIDVLMHVTRCGRGGGCEISDAMGTVQYLLSL